MKESQLKHLIFLLIFCLAACSVKTGNKQSFSVSDSKNKILTEWEDLRFGVFVHFNDNTFIEQEISKNTDVNIFNPDSLDFEGMFSTCKKAGVKYAVLTSRHTSGFCLWDSKLTEFDIAGGIYRKDVVKSFTDACRKFNIKPCIYYCLWGNKDWDVGSWNPTIRNELKSHPAKEVILSQLTELSENYGEIFEFWLDMYCWADTTLKTQEIYNLLKSKNPKTIVHFNQQVQDGTTIKYFPTDITNGEERIPSENGHNPIYSINMESYYLPFEYEITSQCCYKRTLGNGLMIGSVWFTYADSHFYNVDSLYNYINKNYERGGSNILLSTAPDKTGKYKNSDADSLIKLGKLIYGK